MARYSKGLKEQAVKYVEAGNSYGSASKIFGASAMSIRHWHVRYLKLGHVDNFPHLGKAPRVSNEEFIDYVKEHPDETLKEIGCHFGMTDVGALYYMRKTGIRYKKKSHAIVRPARRTEKDI